MSETRARSDGEAGVRHTSESVSPVCCPVVELRQYTLKPGRRNELIALFERHFLEGQIRQRHAISAYRDTLRLLLGYATQRTGLAPSALDMPISTPR
jgi:hypothetical protein